MARPTNASKVERAVADAEQAIKAKLPELLQVALNAALGAALEVQCPHCRKPIRIEKQGDPKLAMSLMERVAGRPDVKKDTGPQAPILDLFERLAADDDEDETPAALTPAQTAAMQAVLKGAASKSRSV